MSDKHTFPVSYGGGKPSDEDLLAGQGMFYVTECGRVMLDCTAGHYQMTWGYNHPALVDAALEAMELGVVWDNHSNIPSHPVKLLGDRLVALGADAGLDRILLGVCTGSVACGAALKIMLARYWADEERVKLGPPVMVALDGNYHGTDMVAQTMRGMWPGLVCGMETVQIEPNEPDGLRAAFARYGRRVAGFWTEPIMMNREAIAVQPEFLKLAERLCRENDALMAVDEIQTGFWYPEVLMFRRLGIRPDLVVVGKGMTAGFHPLSGLLYRSEQDILAQYRRHQHQRRRLAGGVRGPLQPGADRAGPRTADRFGRASLPEPRRPGGGVPRPLRGGQRRGLPQRPEVPRPRGRPGLPQDGGRARPLAARPCLPPRPPDGADEIPAGGGREAVDYVMAQLRELAEAKPWR